VFTGRQGNFELNAMHPIIISNLRHSARVLGDAWEKLRRYAIERARLNCAGIGQNLGRSLRQVTALGPARGCDKTSAIAHQANDQGPSPKGAAHMSGHIDAQWTRSLAPGKWSGTMSAEAEGRRARVLAPSIDSRAVQALLVVLSVIAGCTDILGFLGLNGLFTAHITGNLVVLTAHIVRGDEAQILKTLSVPVFVVVVGLTIMLARGLESIGLAALRPLLLLQFLLLAVILVLCVAAGPHIDPDATNGIVVGILAVSAMAVQNALVQTSLTGAPPTAVHTSNIARLATDVVEVLLGGDPASVAKARNRAARTLRVIIGFAVGCGLGAAYAAALGPWSVALPASLALLAFAIAFAAESDRGER